MAILLFLTLPPESSWPQVRLPDSRPDVQPGQGQPSHPGPAGPCGPPGLGVLERLEQAPPPPDCVADREAEEGRGRHAVGKSAVNLFSVSPGDGRLLSRTEELGGLSS